MGKWKEVKVEDIAKKIQYGYTGKTIKKGNYRYLRITDIQNQSVDWSTVPISDVSSEKDIKKYKLEINDILFARTGATVGKSFLIEDTEPSIFASYLIRVQPKEIVFPKYLYLYFQSESYWKQIRAHEVGAAQPNVNGKKLGMIKFPLPPLPEQQRIVAKLDVLFAAIDQAIRLLEENITHTQALMGSVLDEEFNKVREKGWPLLKFTEFASLRHGHQFRKYDFVESGIPVVKITQCKKDGSLDLSNCDFIDSSRLNEFSEDRIYKDDLLMALTGGTLGKVTWVENDYGELVQNYRVGNFFNIEGKSIKRFLMYILMSSIFQDLVASKVNQGAQPNIGKENIDNMIVPIPSIEEQMRMVEKFDIVMENQSKIIKVQGQKLNHLKSLKSSLLNQAFKGEL